MSDDENWDKDFGFDIGTTKLQLNLSVKPIRLPSPSKDPSPIEVPTLEIDEIGENEKESLKQEEPTHNVNVTTDEEPIEEPIPSSRLSVRIEQEELDWSQDFQEDIPKLKIMGIKANPNLEEDWGDDFDFGEEIPTLQLKSASSVSVIPNLTIASPPVAKRLSELRRTVTLNRVHSSSLLTSAERVSTNLKDMLKQFPDIKDKRKSEHKRIKSNDETKHKRKESTDQENSDKMKEIKAMYDFSYEEYNKDNYVEAMKQSRKAHTQILTLDPEKRDIKFECQLLLLMGMIAQALGDVFVAISYHKQGIDALLSNSKLSRKQPALLSKLYFQVALCHQSTENYAMAVQDFLDSLKSSLSASHKEWKHAAECCYYIGKCAKQLDMHDLSADFLRKSVEIATEVNDVDTKNLATNLLVSMGERSTDKQEVKEIPIVSEEVSAAEEEDWDREMGFDAVQRANLASSLVDNEQPPREKELIPLKYKLLEAVRRDVEIVKYPKATSFYSMKSRDGHRFLSEEALEDFLSNLINKYTAHLLHCRMSRIKKERSKLELRHAFMSKLTLTAKFSAKWFKQQLEFITKLYLLEKIDMCWSAMFDFFVDITGHSAKREQDGTYFLSCNLFTEIVCVVVQVLYLACKLWRPDEDEQFLSMLSSIRKFEPKCTDMITLLQIETYAHHKYDSMEKDLVSYVESLTNVYKNRDRPFGDTEVTYHEFSDIEIRARALADLHFILSDISPLTTVYRISGEDEEYDDHSVKSSSGIEEVALKNNLMDPVVRMELLSKLYLQISTTSYLKAKVAFALGHHTALFVGNLQIAEQLFFECLYILDSCKSGVKSLTPLISELGANALLRYGETLLANFKYHYAALAFESAIENFKLRKRTGYFDLLRRLAAIAKDNDDYKRAQVYYKELLEMYGKENKINEIKYVSEVISTLYMESGDFSKAEFYLKAAIGVNEKNSTPGSPAHGFTPEKDPITFKLRLKLADLYLESYWVEKGIELLEPMLALPLPFGTRYTVLTKLAKAFIKKRWFKECARLLDRLEQELIASAKPGVLEASDKRILKFLELSAVNYYHCKLYSHALHCIDSALHSCPINSLSSMAHFFYIRGKIFQVLSTSTQIQFPTPLRPPHQREGGLRSAPVPHRIYTCSGDLIQECIQSYDKAYSLFKAIGDDIHLAKTVANIAHTYLERVFSPVALLQYSYNDVARLPNFDTSDIIKRGHRRTKSDGSSVVMEKGRKQDFFISLDRIENPAVVALDLCAEIGNPLSIAKSYLNMAELRQLQGDTEASLAFWNECKDQLSHLFLDGASFLGKEAPSNFLRKMLALFKRLVRFIFCFDSEIINKNLAIIDAYLLLKLDYEQSLRRPVQTVGIPLTEDKESPVSQPKTTKSNSEGKSSSKPSQLSQSTTYPPGGSQPVIPIGLQPHGKEQNRVSVTTLFNEEEMMAESTNPKHSDTAQDNIYDRFRHINEETAERIWGFFSAIKTQIQHYTKGRLTKEELLLRNRKIVGKILQVKRANDQMKAGVEKELLIVKLASIRMPSFQDPAAIVGSYDDLAKISPELARLLYILQVDDYIIYFAPSSGNKRIQRIGGKEENLNTGAPSQSTALHLNIHLLTSTEEYVSLLVSPLLPIDKILKYLCNKPYWEQEDPKKKGFFGSFGRTNSVPGKPKFQYRSKDFHEGLLSLLSLLGLPSKNDSSPQQEHKRYTSVELSRISFAKKSINHYDSSSTFSPLTVSTQTIVGQCFSQQEMKDCSSENPLRLYLYLSSDQNELGTVNHSKDYPNKPMLFPQETLNYLMSLINKDPPEESELHGKKIINDLIDATFSGLLDIIPSPTDSETILPPPVILICYHTLQIFPWELIIHDYVVRYFSLEDFLIVNEKHREMRESQRLGKYEEDPWPKYFSFFFSGGDKNLVPLEEKRRSLLVKELQCNLKVRPKVSLIEKDNKQAPSYPRTPLVMSPFHSALVRYGKKITSYKRQYKFITWFDLGGLAAPGDIVKTVESVTLATGVFLLSFADLLEATQPLIRLMRCKPTCTFLFVPASKMKLVVSKLMKVQEDTLKPTKSKPTSQSRYKFLMDSISLLQSEFVSPLAIFNPPYNPTIK